MPRFRRIAAFLLLALWLPAVLHCRLEAAGILGGACCTETHADEATSHTDADACAGDECGTIEGEFTKHAENSAGLVKAPALAAIHWLTLECDLAAELNAALAPTHNVSEARTAPPEIAPSWVFVTRAALPARAPSSLS